jgi:hypothetical protein
MFVSAIFYLTLIFNSHSLLLSSFFDLHNIDLLLTISLIRLVLFLL